MRTPFNVVLIEQFENRPIAPTIEKQNKSWKGGNAFQKLFGGLQLSRVTLFDGVYNRKADTGSSQLIKYLH